MVSHDSRYQEVENIVVSGSVILRVCELGGDAMMYLSADASLEHI